MNIIFDISVSRSPKFLLVVSHRTQHTKQVSPENDPFCKSLPKLERDLISFNAGRFSCKFVSSSRRQLKKGKCVNNDILINAKKWPWNPSNSGQASTSAVRAVAGKVNCFPRHHSCRLVLRVPGSVAGILDPGHPARVPNYCDAQTQCNGSETTLTSFGVLLSADLFRKWVQSFTAGKSRV